MNRKDFLKLGTVLAAGVPMGIRPISEDNNLINENIDFVHDGIQLTPHEYAELLMRLADENKIKPDYYSNGGVVEELEAKFATLFGKEAASFLPTGTLANHMAIRKLSGNNRRVIVQEQSHLYNDSGDCAQTLSNLNLIPLGYNSVEIKPDELEYILKKTKTGRVELKIGALSLETPVRRQMDKMVSDESIKSIAMLAKQNEIKLHLDGARIFVQSAHTKTSPAAYSQYFDTLYTSLWKCFNASSGAILAGSKSFISNLYHERRMFGGSLPAAWPYAAIALYYADSFIMEYDKARTIADAVFTALTKDERITITKFDQGSHIVRLNVKGKDYTKLKASLLKRKIEINDPTENGILLKINPSLNKMTASIIVDAFRKSIDDI